MCLPRRDGMGKKGVEEGRLGGGAWEGGGGRSEQRTGEQRSEQRHLRTRSWAANAGNKHMAYFISVLSLSRFSVARCSGNLLPSISS